MTSGIPDWLEIRLGDMIIDGLFAQMRFCGFRLKFLNAVGYTESFEVNYC